LAGKRRSRVKLTYIQRWRLEHPQICIRVSREEYEFLKEYSDKTRMSYREVLLQALRGLQDLQRQFEVQRERVIEFAREFASLATAKGNTGDNVCSKYEGFERRLCEAVFDAVRPNLSKLYRALADLELEKLVLQKQLESAVESARRGERERLFETLRIVGDLVLNGSREDCDKLGDDYEKQLCTEIFDIVSRYVAKRFAPPWVRLPRF